MSGGTSPGVSDTASSPGAEGAGPRIVIVGAGQAGGWAAATLRKEGHTGTIVLIGDEPHPPYERPPLSKAVLLGTAPPESTHLFSVEAFEKLTLDWRPGVRVSAIDRAAHRLTLADGGSLGYDKLILCMGGRPRLLAIEGAGLPQVHVLRTLADAARLRAGLRPGGRVVVVGGGWIGLETAASARAQGMEAVVVEAGPRLCERSVPVEVSNLLQAVHRSHGVDVRLGAQVTAFEAVGERAGVRLADGTLLVCDLIVVGVGLVPNDELAREAGLGCEGGVCVDAACRSSDPDIYAAGDLAVMTNPRTGRATRLESWQNAQEQGIAAARAVLGRPVRYEPLPWFWSDQFDVNLQIYGVASPSHRVVLRREPGNTAGIWFFLQGDVIEAAIGVNAGRDLRHAKRLIESGKAVDAGRLADPNTAMARQ